LLPAPVRAHPPSGALAFGPRARLALDAHSRRTPSPFPVLDRASSCLFTQFRFWSCVARRLVADDGVCWITQDIHVPEQTIALNRRARHEFTIDETFEAGIVLTGTEIKSVRSGKVNLADAYARIERDEAWLIGAHIAPFEQGNRNNHEPKRIRKLLLHRSEIDELLGRTKAKGQTIVPLRLYLSPRGRAKLELGLARGKQLHDRRRDIADRDARRDIARELADVQRGR
jgi:SsrA-binding protein